MTYATLDEKFNYIIKPQPLSNRLQPGTNVYWFRYDDEGRYKRFGLLTHFRLTAAKPEVNGTRDGRAFRTSLARCRLDVDVYYHAPNIDKEDRKSIRFVNENLRGYETAS